MVKPVGRYRHQMPAVFHSRSRLKIGLVGGSFNPAHVGHIHVALKARQQLGLDQIWWLVSPQNPLKSSLDMAPHEKRLADARKIATSYPFLRVIEPESGLPSNYTYNTMKYIRDRFGIEFWSVATTGTVPVHREALHSKSVPAGT